MKAFLECKSPQPMKRLLAQATAAELPEIFDLNDHV
jgi:hypothetical protein